MSTIHSKDPRELEISNVDNKNNSDKKAGEASLTDEAGQQGEALQAYKVKFDARVARLTHPRTLSESSATLSDRLKEGEEKKQDRGSGVGGEGEGEGEGQKTKTRTMRVLDWLGWKVSPKKDSQTALKEHDLESNGEGRSITGLGAAVEKDDDRRMQQRACIEDPK